MNNGWVKMPNSKIGIIGSGATALYCLKSLYESDLKFEILIFEASQAAGTGMPYRPVMNADFMLCNAFSKEIPHVTRPLIDWLKDQPKRVLSQWELTENDLSAREFYPRVLIGEYLASEFSAVCLALRSKGHIVDVLTQTHVVDIVPSAGQQTIKFNDPLGVGQICVDDVIIATGHSFPDQPKIGNAELTSPWPATNLADIPKGNIGILGSSLSAIDVIAALGYAHGTFDENNGHVTWQANNAPGLLHITMISHRGIMPEGDFYYKLPFEPLKILTETAVAAEIVKGSDQLLERVFRLLCSELDAEDPDYLAEMGVEGRTISGFAEGYFLRRQRLGGLLAVRKDFAKVRQSMRDKVTIANRYVLLRGHMVFDMVLRHLDDSDWDVFVTQLLPVFADCYAAVPHVSLERILALYDAGVLQIVAAGADAKFDNAHDGGVVVSMPDQEFRFDAMIDARGQANASLSELQFQSIVSQLKDPSKPLIEPFNLNFKDQQFRGVYCLALPQILQKYPFSQGLSNVVDLAAMVVADIVEKRR